MALTPKDVHQKFKLNGLHYTHNSLGDWVTKILNSGEAYEKDIAAFFLDWLDDSDDMVMKTSGSTGTPKDIRVKKQAMVNSAITTGQFFKLMPGDTALQCLPATYIAGKMMLVRALVLGLNIDCIKPSTRLVFNVNKTYDFCAMVPLQLQHNIKQSSAIKTIIIGGSKATSTVLKLIRNNSLSCYETYGMTETVSHVALRKLSATNHQNLPLYKALPGIKFFQDKRQCLVIDAPKLVDGLVVTNDVVSLQSKTSFQLLGRFDNVINSAGIKLFPEQIEDKLRAVINQRFFVAGVKDAVLGERLVLIIENSNVPKTKIAQQIKRLATLDKFEIPKVIYDIPHFIETNTGKIRRSKTLIAALKLE